MATTGTDVLTGLRSSGRESLDDIVSLAYLELRSIAHNRLKAQHPGGTLSTTALVHEAYLKLVDQSRAGWQDRAHFLAVASLAMRHVMVDRARERTAQKRGGAQHRVTLEEEDLSIDSDAELLLQLDDAMERLAGLDPRLARVVECKFFGGMTEPETAEALGVTVRTVQRDWVKARLLLQRALDS